MNSCLHRQRPQKSIPKKRVVPKPIVYTGKGKGMGMGCTADGLREPCAVPHFSWRRPGRGDKGEGGTQEGVRARNAACRAAPKRCLTTISPPAVGKFGAMYPETVPSTNHSAIPTDTPPMAWQYPLYVNRTRHVQGVVNPSICVSRCNWTHRGSWVFAVQRQL